VLLQKPRGHNTMNDLTPQELNFLYLLVAQTLEGISDVSAEIFVDEENESFRMLKSINSKFLNRILGGSHETNDI
jgi:hypothetical protein